MSLEKFQRLKKSIYGFWPRDRIVTNTETELIVKCENGVFINCRFIKPTGIPEIDKYFANKILIQYADDLEEKPYTNLAPYIYGRRKPVGRIKEALTELGFRMKVVSILRLFNN